MFLPTTPWQQALYVFIFSLIRYVVFGGIAFLVFYVLLKHKNIFYKIQQRWPSAKDYRREIFYSIITFIFFGMVPVVLNLSFVKPHTTLYRDIHKHSMLYFWLVFPLMLIIHDTYFYWTHRLMHHPKLFPLFHIVHHKSTNPSPWTSFSFNPTEAVVESAIIYVFAFTIPVMPVQLFAFLIFMSLYNVYGHLGFEIYPHHLNRHPIGKWFNTSVNHNMHHQYFKGNYGLYFTFWDRVMGTMNKNYEDSFESVTARNYSKLKIIK